MLGKLKEQQKLGKQKKNLMHDKKCSFHKGSIFNEETYFEGRNLLAENARLISSYIGKASYLGRGAAFGHSGAFGSVIAGLVSREIQTGKSK